MLIRLCLAAKKSHVSLFYDDLHAFMNIWTGTRVGIIQNCWYIIHTRLKLTKDRLSPRCHVKLTSVKKSHGYIQRSKQRIQNT